MRSRSGRISGTERGSRRGRARVPVMGSEMEGGEYGWGRVGAEGRGRVGKRLLGVDRFRCL
jgi:hypothetical protein